MFKIELCVYEFDELSKESKAIAKDNINDFLQDVLNDHIAEIKASKDAYLNSYYSGTLDQQNKDDYSLTGVCYDYDFLSIDHVNSLSVENDVNKVFMKLKRDEKKCIYSDEYVSDLCNCNEIYFLANGVEYYHVKKLIK